jgi:hypothetical protein
MDLILEPRALDLQPEAAGGRFKLREIEPWTLRVFVVGDSLD